MDKHSPLAFDTIINYDYMCYYYYNKIYDRNNHHIYEYVIFVLGSFT